MKTKTTITVETWKFESIRSGSERRMAFCHSCGMETEPLSVFESAARLDIAEAEVLHRLRMGTLHLAEGGGRVARVCGLSLK